MSELVVDCPRCKAANMTFDLRASSLTGVFYDWQKRYEVFCVCRKCKRSTVFSLLIDSFEAQQEVNRVGLEKIPGVVNQFVQIQGYVSLKDVASISSPEFLPDHIKSAFDEGATCLSVGCFNAAATMFRLCLDFATIDFLPETDEQGLNAKIRRSLGFRMEWLFDNHKIPEALRDLSHCVKEDGNDGAHQGILGKEDAEDLLDFTVALLERLYTEPRRLEIAKERRAARRAAAA